MRGESVLYHCGQWGPHHLMLDSIFAISIGAHLGVSNPLLAPIASSQTWDMLALVRDTFKDNCQQSPSLSVMAESIRKLLRTFPDRDNRVADRGMAAQYKSPNTH